MAVGNFESVREGETAVIRATGAWTIEATPKLDAALRAFSVVGARLVRFDLGGLEALDTAGAWLISRTQALLAGTGVAIEIVGLKPAHATLFKRVVEAGAPPALAPPPGFDIYAVLANLGEGTIGTFRQGRDLCGFFGAILIAISRVLLHPSRIRFVSLVSHIEQHGLNALPIIGLINFLVGIVIAYQGFDQLRQFGAEVFTVDLVGISVLREMGILLTAIIVAGRSGSAFTAQIGTMKVNEEVDAMQTLGLDPLEILVLPRLFALLIALPLLTFFADMLAILGGALMSTILIDMTFAQFLGQLNQAVEVKHFFVGLSKAPVFAFIIAMVGCFEGLRVTGSAESVGKLTTQSVVESIFLVIVFDALFSIFFSYMGI
ncbi:MAG: ABC transporter permease [Dongiaceae bacterium]